jgi:hypothetical protein
MCDASAAVAVGGQFLVVGDDEESVLRVYRQEGQDESVQAVAVGRFLNGRRRKAEVDLEGAACLGDCLYWISSHGCDADGKSRPSRRRFFGTRFGTAGDTLQLEPVGRPYTRLLDDLLEDPRLAPFELEVASRRAPTDRGALNIEGLCASPAGHLLIGFRNPIPQGKALLIPLVNPQEVVTGSRARLGDPLLLDLWGLGIRSMTYGGGRYVIVAGSFDGSSPSRIYEWHGGTDRPQPLDLAEAAVLNPEAVSFASGGSRERLWLLSDDGMVEIDGCKCKRLKDPSRKQFRALCFDL